MCNVIDRTTFEYRRSVNTPDYPEKDYIISPDVSKLASVPRMYWKVVGDTVVEMNQTEKDAVDDARAPSPTVCPSCAHEWVLEG